MDEKNKPIGFATACMKFFGKREGQLLGDFVKEVKALTIVDKKEMIPMLSEALDVVVTE
jgi:hypothetical protein